MGAWKEEILRLAVVSACNKIAAKMKEYSHLQSLEVDKRNPNFVDGVYRMIQAGWSPTDREISVLCWPVERIDDSITDEEVHRVYQKLAVLDGFNEVNAFLDDYYA